MINKEIFVYDRNDNFITGSFMSFPSTAALIEFCSRLMSALQHFAGKSHTTRIEHEALGITMRLSEKAKKDGIALPIKHPLAEYNSDNYPPFILRLNMLYNIAFFLEEDNWDAVSSRYPDEFENGEIAEFPKDFFLNFEWKDAGRLHDLFSEHLKTSHIWYNPTAEGDYYYAAI